MGSEPQAALGIHGPRSEIAGEETGGREETEQSERGGGGGGKARAVRAGVDSRGHPTLCPEVQRPRPGCSCGGLSIPLATGGQERHFQQLPGNTGHGLKGRKGVADA